MSASEQDQSPQTMWVRFRSWPIAIQVLAWWLLLPVVLVILVMHRARGLPVLARGLLGAGAFVLIGVMPLVLYVWASGSAHEVMFPSVDDPVLVRQIEAACPSEPRTVGNSTVETIRQENAELREFIEVLDSLDTQRVADDRPVADWIDDWKGLLATRANYLRRLRTRPNAERPKVPSTEGYSVAVRMSEMGGVDCEPQDWILDDFDTGGLKTTRERDT